VDQFRRFLGRHREDRMLAVRLPEINSNIKPKVGGILARRRVTSSDNAEFTRQSRLHHKTVLPRFNPPPPFAPYPIGGWL